MVSTFKNQIIKGKVVNSWYEDDSFLGYNAQMMETVCTSEKPVYFSKTTVGVAISQKNVIFILGYDNLKSHSLLVAYFTMPSVA
jgi:hypothetical protein